MIRTVNISKYLEELNSSLNKPDKNEIYSSKIFAYILNVKWHSKKLYKEELNNLIIDKQFFNKLNNVFRKSLKHNFNIFFIYENNDLIMLSDEKNFIKFVRKYKLKNLFNVI